MLLILRSLTISLLSALESRRAMALRILVLEHQIRVLQRRRKRPRLSEWDRALWILLSRTWSHWRAHLHLVRPETVVDWHRRRFRRYWTRKSRQGPPGRPTVPIEIRQLIRKMAIYHHTARTHLGLGKDTPIPRAVLPPSVGEVIEFPEVGGLHHRYERRAA